MYLEPWHADVFDFLDLRKNTGKEEQVNMGTLQISALIHLKLGLSVPQRARDLFYAMWVPDLFMKRVEADAEWSLMCPNECPGLHEVWGEEFEELYKKCVLVLIAMCHIR